MSNTRMEKYDEVGQSWAEHTSHLRYRNWLYRYQNYDLVSTERTAGRQTNFVAVSKQKKNYSLVFKVLIYFRLTQAVLGSDI